MEEATELFAIQQRQVSALLARTNALAAAAAVTPRPVSRPMAPAPAPAGPPVQALANVDPWGEGLVFLALGAGLLAALAKRAREPGAAPPAAAPTTPTTGRRR